VLNQTNARSVVATVVEPVARGLIKIGLSPDAVTLIGTIGVSTAALVFFPDGRFAIGVLVIVLFVFSDLLDGTMARMLGRKGPWGAFLDSTLDRVADGFLFGALLIWAARTQSNLTVAAAMICLVGGMVISYAKARAEGLGMQCNVGIAERTERLIIILLAAFIYGLGVPYVLPGAMWVLAVLTVITVGQRVMHVRRMSQSAAPKEG
jgi:CDP-diacylglycerol---glycerol-3-phosphate 3-phosphatidyltransferase